MKNLNNLLLTTVYIGMLSACSTVVQIPSSKSEINLPSPKQVKEIKVSSASDASTGKRDKKDKIRVAVVDNINHDDSSALTLLIAKKRISKLFSSPKVEYLELPVKIADGIKKESEDVREYLLKNKIDAVFFIYFNKKDESFEYSLKLILSGDYRQVGELSGPVNLISKNIDTSHRSDMYADGKNVSFLREVNLSSVAVKSPGETSIQDFWAAVTSGLLNVRSSTPGAQISMIVDNKKILIGTTPMNDYRLDEGDYEIEIFRKGLSPVRKKVEIVAGASTNIYIPWPDDPYTTSLAFWTEPESMRMMLDGEVKGETPVFLNDIEGGSYDIGLGVKKNNGSYKDVIKTSITIRQGQVNTLAFFYKYSETFADNFQSREFWHKVSEKGHFQLKTGNGLSFQSADPSAIVGVESMDFPIRSFDARLTIESQNNEFLLFGVKSLLDSVLIQSNADGFSGGVFEPDTKTIAMPVFRDKKPENKEHVLRIKYKSSNSTVQLYVDGALIGRYPWKPDGTGRFVVLGRAGESKFKFLTIEMQGK